MIVCIDGECYKLRYRDLGNFHPEDCGLWRADKVQCNEHGHWFCCDDDDYLITDDGRIVAKETGWELRREKIDGRKD